ncbi:MAG: hypothetical protein F2723_05800 [Actinobacteria bacterium]|nr:hypothetical protein [Actinomycetota bacterium]MSZ29189.1 hypothetical protein [Actinomycetota bacterium]
MWTRQLLTRTESPVGSLLVARHGQSTWNALGRWQGKADPELTALGEQQAQDAALHVGDISSVWASNLQRAKVTASIIAKAKGLEVNIDERLSERDAGEWEGMTRLEIEDGWPGFLAGHKRPDGFEPDESVAQRGIEALSEILANGGDGRILVVSHSGVVRAIERHLGVSAGQVSNLGGVEFHLNAIGELTIGERFMLLDGSKVEITTPKQI